VSGPATRDRIETSLLEDFLAQVVVDDYAPVSPHEDTRPWFSRYLAALPAFLLIGILVATAVISTRSSDEERQATRTALSDRVSSLAAEVSSVQQRVDEQSANVDALRSTALEAGASEQQRQQIEALTLMAGATELSGPGITVTIDNAPGAEAGSLNQVLDRDLQDLVNLLWSTGASGIAVNDQRLTGTTAIRGAGDAILVNYQPLTRPYVITAIGTSTAGGGDSGLQALLTSLADDYGLVSTVSTGDVALPVGEVRVPRFASTDDEGSQQ
jgi:uncharacterized protein YlxW (UPF0749 family)